MCTDFGCSAPLELSSPHKLFDAIDTDGDGELSFAELGVKMSEYGLSDGEKRDLFNFLDTNGDGKVDRVEFTAGFEKFQILQRGGKDQLRVWEKPTTSSGTLWKKASRIQACCSNGPVPLTKAGLLPDEPPRLVFVGCTGSGKSSLCTALTGQEKGKSTFKLGKGAQSETYECKSEEHWWFGDEEEGKFLCVDTPGLNDSEGRDEEHISGIIEKMKKLDYVSCIVLVLNGTEPRFHKSLQDVIAKFEEAFCSQRGTQHENFYDNLIVCFQRWKLSEEAELDRKEEKISAESVANDFRQQFMEKFPQCRNTSRPIPCVFVDSHDRDAARKTKSLGQLKAALPSDVFRTGDLQQIVPRLVAFNGIEQIFVRDKKIVPMLPRLADERIKVNRWHVTPSLPAGLSISPNGIISGTPAKVGRVAWSVVAESIGGSSAEFKFSVDVLFSESDIQTMVRKYRNKCSSIFTAAGVGAEAPTDEAGLDAVLQQIEDACHKCVEEAKEELQGTLEHTSQFDEIINRVSLAASETKTAAEIEIRVKYGAFASAQADARLELEKADNKVQRLLLHFHTDAINFQELSKATRHLELLNPAEGSEQAGTLTKAQARLEEIKPTPCPKEGCPHVGPACKMEEHVAGCLFALKLIPHSAVNKTIPDSCEDGFELVALNPENGDYAGTYKPGPCPPLDDDKPGWFHVMNQPEDCISRIKQVDGKWILSSKHIPGNSWSSPGTERDILQGETADKVDGANFNGFSMTPLPKLSLADTWEHEPLKTDCVKLMYFGGAWCPYCPPFTAKLKLFSEIVQEEMGADALQVIFVSSDKSEEEMIDYFGAHHGDWYALPYEERELKSKLSNKHRVSGIPCLKVLDNSGDSVPYFEEDGGEFSILDQIRHELPGDKAHAKVKALEIFNVLKTKCFPCPSEGLVGTDYFDIEKAVTEARELDDSKANVVGNLKDLQTGKFGDAACGLKSKLGIGCDWKEDEHCTIDGILAEVARLADCAECAKQQSDVLHELGREEEAQDTRRLADALAHVKLLASQKVDPSSLEEARKAVSQLRAEIAAKGGWYYGCKAAAPKGVEWPAKAVVHPFNPSGFSQPMCSSCKQYRLDHLTISQTVQYVVFDQASELQCFNGVRDKGRKGQTLQYFKNAEEVAQAGLTDAEIVGLRYYTSHAFDSINEALRDPERRIPHPLPALTCCVQSAIKKLRSVNSNSEEATSEKILWRGFRDMQLTEVFEKQGGTEPAPMSTTGDVTVAVGYAVRKGLTAQSLLFRIKTTNNLQRGVSVKWVSMFPDEDETLYPPLTFMETTGQQQTLVIDGVTINVVEVTTTIS